MVLVTTPPLELVDWLGNIVFSAAFLIGGAAYTGESGLCESSELSDPT